MANVSIPVMAKARIGHFGEARVIQSLNVDCIDESEVLTVADTVHHIRKTQFEIPFVCGAEDLGSALRRIAEGAHICLVRFFLKYEVVFFLRRKHDPLKRQRWNWRRQECCHTCTEDLRGDPVFFLDICSCCMSSNITVACTCILVG